MLTKKQIEILEKAEMLFAKHGTGATTVRDIADALNMSAATTSYHFGSKEKLIETLFRYRMESNMLSIENIAGNVSLTPYQRIQLILGQYVGRVFEMPNFYKMMMTEQMLNSNRNIIKYIGELKNNYRQLLEGVINEGIARGDFKPRAEIDHMLLSSCMTGTVMQVIINRHFFKLLHNDELQGDDGQTAANLIGFINEIFKNQLGYLEK